MKVDVRMFARVRDLAGAERIMLELPQQARVRDLRAALLRRYPGLASLAPSLLVAVGNDYADDGVELSDKSEVACFPPVSGG
jgi:molybdopterin synthase sulfur carrier subunit